MPKARILRDWPQYPQTLASFFCEVSYMQNRKLYQTLLTLQTAKYKVPYKKAELRVSSLPFCPLIFVKDNLTQESTREFKSDFYFKSGNAIHELWQETATKILPKNLIGDYACHKVIATKVGSKSTTFTRCNRVVSMCSADHAKQQPCLHADKVAGKDCQHHQQYQELQLNWQALSGHTDFIYLDAKDQYHLVDFKTTGLFLFDKPDVAVKLGYYPSKKYIVQLETYVIMLERQHNLKITSYTIAYVSRDRAVDEAKKPALKLFTYEVTDKIRQARTAITKKYLQQHKIAVRWLRQKKKATNTASINDKLWESRPCQTKRDYLTKMKPAFFTDCPHLDTCLSGKFKKEFK